MRTSAAFAPSSPDAIDHLIAAHPFALVISANGGMPLATPLPLLLERSSDGTTTLIGHFPRTHPHTEVLRRDPRALAVFLGSHGYISPSWLADRTQAPTWNYETAQLEINVEFDGSTEATDAALSRLVGTRAPQRLVDRRHGPALRQAGWGRCGVPRPRHRCAYEVQAGSGRAQRRALGHLGRLGGHRAAAVAGSYDQGELPELGRQRR